MAYTVSALAKISGVSVRLLHWYDEIGLLKPAYVGSNDYRYYEEPQLLALQQILFLKEIGFSLNDIQKLLTQNDFDNIKALRAHREILEDEINRKNALLTTIDKTINHLKGEETMTDKELYNGLDQHTAKKYDTFLVKSKGTVAEEVIAANQAREISEDDKKRITQENVKVYSGIAALMNKGHSADSLEVQSLVKKHADLLFEYHGVNRDLYLSYADLYASSPEFRDYFTNYDPKLVDFIVAAMKCYAEESL